MRLNLEGAEGVDEKRQRQRRKHARIFGRRPHANKHIEHAVIIVLDTISHKSQLLSLILRLLSRRSGRCYRWHLTVCLRQRRILLFIFRELPLQTLQLLEFTVRHITAVALIIESVQSEATWDGFG